MAFLREWLHRLWGFLRAGRRDSDLERELRAPLELAAEDAKRQGAAANDAAREARLRDGNPALAMDAVRDQRGLPWFDDLTRDIRYALRTLRRSRRSGCGILAVIVACLTYSSCASGPSSPSSAIALGLWGGDHVTMTVKRDSAQFEFDCAHGDVGSMLIVDARGRFNATGTFVREHGGPIRDGEVPDSHPATYSGSATGRTLVLTVRLTDLEETIGTFVLAHESPGRILKCL